MFFCSSRRRHTRCALVTGVQTCALPICMVLIGGRLPKDLVERLAIAAQARLKERGDNIPVIAPVARAALSEDAPAVGAAILPFSHFLLPKPGALWKAPADTTRRTARSACTENDARRTYSEIVRDSRWARGG